ncbi:MAG: LysR family transcriptional regulator [Alphaproteobacteria bacterium]|nr:LysR family transcriptional regulator [Alphaproteobacteria bacterium]
MQAFRWDDLRHFLAVVEAGTLTGAATTLGVNASTVWRRVGALEQDLGARLFDRLPEGYALTDAGEALLPRATQMQEEACALLREVAGAEALPEGRVVVTAPESLLPLLTPMVLAFTERWPAIVLELDLADRLYDLGRREADVAIRPGPQPPDAVLGRRVCAVAWTVYGPAGVPPKECHALPWAGYGEGLSQLAAERWREAQGEPPPSLRVSSVPAMACLLRSGRLRGMLPCFVGDADPALGRLAARIPEAESALWLLLHTDLRRTARVRRFVDFAWAWLRERVAVFEGG